MNYWSSEPTEQRSNPSNEMTKQSQFLITAINPATYETNPQQTKDEWELGGSSGTAPEGGPKAYGYSLAVAGQLGILVRDGLRRLQVGVFDHELF